MLLRDHSLSVPLAAVQAEASQQRHHEKTRDYNVHLLCNGWRRQVK